VPSQRGRPTLPLIDTSIRFSHSGPRFVAGACAGGIGKNEAGVYERAEGVNETGPRARVDARAARVDLELGPKSTGKGRMAAARR